MSDEDRAQEIELQEWERNNRSRKVPAQVKYQPHEHGYGPAECVSCDAEMPLARREYGFDLCVACKTEAEQVAKHYAR